MTFYVNEVTLPESDWTHRCIGLFDNDEWDGRGSFCGYYGAEYYLNTTLLAYGVQLIEGNKRYNPKDPFDGGFINATSILTRFLSEAVCGRRKSKPTVSRKLSRFS